MDYDHPEFFDARWRCAKRQHHCCECRGAIFVGESYQYVVGKWDGDFNSFKTCKSCEYKRSLLGKKYNNVRGFGGICFGELRDALDEARSSGLIHPLEELAMEGD